MRNTDKNFWKILSMKDNFPTFDKEVFILIEDEIIYDKENYIPVIKKAVLRYNKKSNSPQYTWMIVDPHPDEEVLVLQSEDVIAWRYV